MGLTIGEYYVIMPLSVLGCKLCIGPCASIRGGDYYRRFFANETFFFGGGAYIRRGELIIGTLRYLK